MSYTVSSSERTRGIGAEYETKAIAQEFGLGTPFDWENNYEYYTAWHKI